MGRMKQILLSAGVCALGVIAGSQNLCAQSSSPLDITAQQTLEWHRDKQEFIARGDVVASQDGMQILCETLTATYKDGEGGDAFELQTLIARENVRIESADGIAYGDVATYSVLTGKADLTGADSRLESDDITVYANEKFIYDLDAGRLETSGGGRAIQKTDKGENIIIADELVATFDQESSGQDTEGRQMKTVEAHGNVKITTPTEIVTGDQLIYQKNTNIAELTGNVEIKREDNILQGSRAKVNLNTNVSTLYGGENGRVRGTFYPSKEGAFSATP